MIKETYERDVKILAYALNVAENPKSAIESVIRAGNIAKVLYTYTESEITKFINSISSSQEGPQITKAQQ
jgi:hypothetical protein